MKKLILYGADILAEMAKFYFEYDSEYVVSGFAADTEYVRGKDSYLDLPLVPFGEVVSRFSPAEFEAFVAVGYSDMNRNRERIMQSLRKSGYKLATYVASSCCCWDRKSIGDNCMIMENVIIQPFAKIGDGCIISAGAAVNHGSCLGSNVFMGSNAVIGGCVHVGDNSFIGINASVRDHVNVAEFSLIGVGAYIANDTEPFGVYGTSGSIDVLAGRDELERKSVQSMML